MSRAPFTFLLQTQVKRHDLETISLYRKITHAPKKCQEEAKYYDQNVLLVSALLFCLEKQKQNHKT